MSEAPKLKLVGMGSRIDEHRSVWIGKNDGDPTDTSYFLAFTNDANPEPHTYLRLSPEAMRALIELTALVDTPDGWVPVKRATVTYEVISKAGGTDA